MRAGRCRQCEQAKPVGVVQGLCASCAEGYERHNNPVAYKRLRATYEQRRRLRLRLSELAEAWLRAELAGEDGALEALYRLEREGREIVRTLDQAEG